MFLFCSDDNFVLHGAYMVGCVQACVNVSVDVWMSSMWCGEWAQKECLQSFCTWFLTEWENQKNLKNKRKKDARLERAVWKELRCQHEVSASAEGLVEVFTLSCHWCCGALSLSSDWTVKSQVIGCWNLALCACVCGWLVCISFLDIIIKLHYLPATHPLPPTALTAGCWVTAYSPTQCWGRGWGAHLDVNYLPLTRFEWVLISNWLVYTVVMALWFSVIALPC